LSQCNLHTSSLNPDRQGDRKLEADRSHRVQPLKFISYIRGRTANGISTSTARNGSSPNPVEINVECLTVQFHIVLLP
jgi:hypothetical protein